MYNIWQMSYDAPVQIGFSAQPAQVMTDDASFGAAVLSLLKRWLLTRARELVRASFEDRVYVLSEAPTANLNLVMLHSDALVHLCAVEMGPSAAVAQRYAPLAAVDWIAPTIFLSLNHLDRDHVRALAMALEVLATPHQGEVTHESELLLRELDARARRWGSSAARDNFRELFEEARTQPQIVERGGDEMLVFSRRYLEARAGGPRRITGRSLAALHADSGLDAEALGPLRKRRLKSLQAGKTLPAL